MFNFQDADDKVCNALHLIYDIVLKVTPVTYLIDPHANCSIQSMMMCYNFFEDPEDDDELHNVNISESEGIHGVAAPDIQMDSMNQPLHIKKVDIGTTEKPKRANVGDYCGEEMIGKITYLLHEL